MSSSYLLYFATFVSGQEVTRSHNEHQERSVEDSALDLPINIARALMSDPIALSSLLLLVAFYIGQLVSMPTKTAERVSVKRSVPRERRKDGEEEKEARDSFGASVVFNQQLTRATSIEAVLRLAGQNDNMDLVNVVTAIHRCTKFAIADNQQKQLNQNPRFVALVDQLYDHFDADIPACQLTRAVGNASWSLAKLQFKESSDKKILSVLCANFVLYAEKFKPEELMNTVWAFADMCKENDQVHIKRAIDVAKAAARCANEVGEVSEQQAIYFSWALARLASIAVRGERPNAAILRGFSLHKKFILERLQHADLSAVTTKNVAMLCWALTQLTKYGHAAEVSALLLRVAEHVTERGFKAFYPGEICSVLGALNKCQVKGSSFVAAYKLHLLDTGFDKFSTQDLTTTVCAYVNMSAGDDLLYTRMSDAAAAMFAKFNRLEKTMLRKVFLRIPHIKQPAGLMTESE
jgi:hypothetical protein